MRLTYTSNSGPEGRRDALWALLEQASDHLDAALALAQAIVLINDETAPDNGRRRRAVSVLAGDVLLRLNRVQACQGRKFEIVAALDDPAPGDEDAAKLSL